MTRSEPRLNLSDGLVLLGTSLLGSLVLVVPVLGVKIAGQSSLVSWLILIAFMVPMAIVFGELGRTYPRAGGVSHWGHYCLQGINVRLPLSEPVLALLVLYHLGWRHCMALQ